MRRHLVMALLIGSLPLFFWIFLIENNGLWNAVLSAVWLLICGCFRWLLYENEAYYFLRSWRLAVPVWLLLEYLTHDYVIAHLYPKFENFNVWVIYAVVVAVCYGTALLYALDCVVKDKERKRRGFLELDGVQSDKLDQYFD